MVSALSSVAAPPGQSPVAIAAAHKAAGAGAGKSLRKSDASCASGQCRPSFKTKEQAAKAALDKINSQSIADNKEYAGQIYQNADGTYGYTDPVQGSGDESHPSSSPAPDGTQIVGNYHTHGDYSVLTDQGLTRATDVPGLTNPAQADAEADNFSDPDIRQYNQLNQKYPGFTGYLGTPGGNMRAFDPTTGANTIIGPLKK